MVIHHDFLTTLYQILHTIVDTLTMDGIRECIAGEDLGLKYGGEEYKAFYEKNNVSSTVDK